MSALATEPAMEGSEGQRAFDELALYYARDVVPPYKQALLDLSAADEAKRVSSGKYLLALFQQLLADERNGRAEWRRSMAWGGGADSPAREFRKQLAKAFGSATAMEGLDAALWLVEEDQLAENQKQGVRVLCRIHSPRSEEVFKRLLAQPHPCAAVTVAVLNEAGQRQIQGLKADVVRLSTHYRTAVREAARNSARMLGDAEPLPEFKPAEAFTPWLDERLKEIATMVRTAIPKEAHWVRLVPVDTEPNGQAFGESAEVNGWLLAEDEESFRVLTWFNSEETLEKALVRSEHSLLSEAAEALAATRQQGEDDPRDALSRSGMLTGQFEPGFISLPEALVAAWSYSRGDKESAAAVLFPCIERTADDRWVFWAVRDLIGHGYHQAMLESFSHSRDYDRTLALAQHLSKPVFDGYSYQERAKELAEQLARRRDDFHDFKLPSEEEWGGLQTKLNRDEQIKYLAARLRLLNCFQFSQPGGVSYKSPQSAAAGAVYLEADEANKVINPYTELLQMRLEIAELPALIPFLADENFMPTFSYWRDFHPDRTLHRVNWAVAEIVNDAAHRDLAQLRQFMDLDANGRQAHLGKLLAWCRENSGKTRTQLVLQTLADSKEWPEFQKAAGEAVRLKLTEAYPQLARRVADFPESQDDVAELCYALNAPEAAVDARRWITLPNKNTRFWAALILLKHGNMREGYDTLVEVLTKDDGSYLYPRAIEPLLAAKTEDTMKLAVGILNKQRFELTSFESGAILHRLFLAGRRECLDYLIEKLDSEEAQGSSSGEWNGMPVERDQVMGDWAADVVTEWRADNVAYERLAPDQSRRRARENLKAWLNEQFSLIQSGKPTHLKAPEPFQFGRWQLDAP